MINELKKKIKPDKSATLFIKKDYDYLRVKT